MTKVQENKPKVIAYFFCKKADHIKQDCIKYQKWLIKKGISHAYVCSEINLALVPPHTLWIDIGATIHICNPLQDFQTQRRPSPAERYVYMGDGNKLQLKLLVFLSLD